MNFRSVAQLSDLVLHWSRRLPPFDVVAGVPRSGLLVASLVAAYRNVPLTDIDGLIEGRCFPGGESKRHAARGRAYESPLGSPSRVLVVDDSLWKGATLRRVRARIEAAGLPHTVEYGAVYVLPGMTGAVDHYAEVLHPPRVFEWNVMHVNAIRHACFDMDGVLCYDPPSASNDDGPAYRAFIQNARPLLLPTAPVGWVVTSRLEKYRAETEAWLAEHGVTYDHLVMLDYPDGSTRRKHGIHAAYKAEVYRSVESPLFIESSLKQAFEIALLSGKEVLCTDTMQMVYPGTNPLPRPVLTTRDVHAPSASGRLARRVVPPAARRAIRRLLP